MTQLFRFYRKLQKEIKADYSRNKNEIKAGVPPTFEEYWRYLPHFWNTYHNSYFFTRYLIDLTKGLVDPGDWRKVDCVQVRLRMDLSNDYILSCFSGILLRMRPLRCGVRRDTETGDPRWWFGVSHPPIQPHRATGKKEHSWILRFWIIFCGKVISNNGTHRSLLQCGSTKARERTSSATTTIMFNNINSQIQNLD